MAAVVTYEYQLLNVIEAGVWILIGIVCLLSALRIGWSRRQRWIAAGVFVLFGISDLVETLTGTWWRPWWLLVWKIGCIALILLLTVTGIRRKRQETTDS